MALRENNLQQRFILAQDTITLNGLTGASASIPGIERSSVVQLSLNTVGVTGTASAPYVSDIVPTAVGVTGSFSVKSATVNANDVYNYVVWNR